MNLQYHMILEFTERVEQLHVGAQPSQLVLEVTRYIQHHLSEPISTGDIAKQLYLSRPHLSQKFKKETGPTLTDFIQDREKLQLISPLAGFQIKHGIYLKDQ